MISKAREDELWLTQKIVLNLGGPLGETYLGQNGVFQITARNSGRFILEAQAAIPH
jgi:hypothetical protein